MSENTDVTDEDVGELSGPTAVDKALDLSMAKIYRVSAVAAVFDSPILSFEHCDVQLPVPAPLQNDEGTVIGFAHLCLEGNKLMADLALDYATPERLLLETQSSPLYLHVIGAMVFGGVPIPLELGALDLVGRKRMVGMVQVQSLILSHQQTRNLGLAPVGR